MRLEPPRRYRTLGRSIRLFRSFLVEQTDPDRFSTDLAEDTVRLVSDHETLVGRVKTRGAVTTNLSQSAATSLACTGRTASTRPH